MKAKGILAPFFILSFLISWTAWGLLIFFVTTEALSSSSPLYMFLFILGGFGPTIAPFLVLPLRLGKGGFRQFLRTRLFRFRTSWKSYAAAVILPCIIMGFAWLASDLFAPRWSHRVNPQPWYMLFALFPAMIVGGGLEEVGWRGTALTEMLRKIPPLPATLILSVLWMIWHYPLFLIPGTSQYGTSFLFFCLSGVGISFLLSTVLILGKSAVPCIVAHALYNALFGLGWRYPLHDFSTDFWLRSGELLLGVLVFLTVLRGGMRKIPMPLDPVPQEE